MQKLILSVMLSGVLCLRFGSAFAQNAALPALATANWSTTAAASLSTNPPTNAAVTELINYLQTPVIPGVEPNTTCSFGFANLRNSGTLSLVAAVNQGMGYCNSIPLLFSTRMAPISLYLASWGPEEVAMISARCCRT